MLVIIFYSDRPQNYRILSIICLLPTAILEFPHTLLPDPTNIIDISVHIAGGITIFMIINNLNLKTLPIEKRNLYSILAVIGFIIALEVFQILLYLFADIGGPVTLDVLEDVFLTIGGGIIGLIITKFHSRYWEETEPS